MSEAESHYVSRAGLKLEHALREFKIDPTGLTCADFGCNVGGFTDCLLQHGAGKVHAIDTGYGTLAWKLRQDPRVIVHERANALHFREKVPDTFFDLVVIDLGWTPQRLAIPAALGCLKPTGHIISLVKPHYELMPNEKESLLRNGVLHDADAARIFERTLASFPALGAAVNASTISPIRGSKSGRKSGHSGNVEYVVFCRSIDAESEDSKPHPAYDMRPDFTPDRDV